MKRIKLAAAIFGMLATGSATARAQSAEQTQKMNAAMERMRSAMSNGGSEGVASAGDGVFMNLADLARPAADDASVVRSAPSTRSKPKAVLANYKPATCWEVCVSFGPLNVCYTWETRCR